MSTAIFFSKAIFISLKFLFSCFPKSCKRQNGQGEKRFTVQQIGDGERKMHFWQFILIMKTEQGISFFFLTCSFSLNGQQEAAGLLIICILCYCMGK